MAEMDDDLPISQHPVSAAYTLSVEDGGHEVPLKDASDGAVLDAVVELLAISRRSVLLSAELQTLLRDYPRRGLISPF